VNAGSLLVPFLNPRVSAGSGSFQEDAPFQIVAMKKQVQTSNVHIDFPAKLVRMFNWHAPSESRIGF
jgi:hypothetical protein